MLFLEFLNHLKWHLSIKYLIGVFVPFIILHMKVFLLTMAMGLQLAILHKEPKYSGFIIFIYQHWQESKYTINMSFCSFYLAPHKSIFVRCASGTIG